MSSDQIITDKCISPEKCCIGSNSKFIDCYNPGLCAVCDELNNRVLSGDEANALLKKECKECGPNGKPISTCGYNEKCCGNGICYDPKCETCVDKESGQKTNKCSYPLQCCEKEEDPAPCYNPKECEECVAGEIIKGPNACSAKGSKYKCCTNYGCYDENCQNCTTYGITNRCSIGQDCVSCGGIYVCKGDCDVCRNGQLVDIMLTSNKDPQCNKCEGGKVVPRCKGAMKCCYGSCYDDDCSYCDTDNTSPTFMEIVDDCGPDKICCQCQSYSSTYDPEKCCHLKKDKTTGCDVYCDGSDSTKISGVLRPTINCPSGQKCCNNQCYPDDGCRTCISEDIILNGNTVKTYRVAIDPGDQGFNDCCVNTKKNSSQRFNNNIQQCCDGIVMDIADPSCCYGKPMTADQICCNKERLFEFSYGCCADQKFSKFSEECCKSLYVVKKGNCCTNCATPDLCCGPNNQGEYECIDPTNPCESCETQANGNRILVKDSCSYKDDSSVCCAFSGTSSSNILKYTKCMNSQCWYCDPNFGPKQSCLEPINLEQGTTSCCGPNPDCYNPECHTCVDGLVRLKDGFILCNDDCCPENRGCNPTTGECCPEGMAPCGDTCCNPEQCCISQFVPPAPGGYNSSLSQEYNYQTKILSSQCLSPGYFCCNNIAYSKSTYKECCNNTPIGLDETCCTKSDGSKFVCSSGEKCCGDICCGGTCCNGKDCCDVACCSGPYGGCYNSNSCQECSAGIVIPKCLGQQCCDGMCYNSKKCETCQGGQIIPYSPSNPNCYCSNGSNICNCPTISTSCDSRSGWQGTGFIVENGMILSITASGTVYWMGPSYTSGPDGVDHPYCSDLRFLHEALLGQVGNGPVFLIGSSYNGTPGGTGELRLITNDDCRWDNNGSYQVTITCI